MHPIYEQAVYYGILMVITILIVSLFFKGFFWKYVKVRLSFGRYAMVKVRNVLRDYFTVGWIEEGMLTYKGLDKKKMMISIADKKKSAYRCLNVFWFDVDENKNCIGYTDYSTDSGFDARKFSDLLTRALMKPAITSGYEKMILGALVVLGIMLIASIYLSFKNMTAIDALTRSIPQIANSLKGVVTGSNSVI